MTRHLHLELRLGLSALAMSTLLGVVAGCGNSSDSMDQNPPPPMVPAATYYTDIKPVMDRYCNDCHQAGNIAPFALTDYNSVQSHAAMIQSAVSSGIMPPWMPADDSMPMNFSRQMRPQDKQLLLDWITAGAPAGDPSSPPRTDIPPAQTNTPPRPDMVLQASMPYKPDTSMGDDYHCFVFDPKLDHDRFLTAGNVLPQNAAIVHHVVVYLVPAAQAAAVEGMDPTGTGYTCFGGAGNNINAGIVVAWAPGGTSMRTPDSTAFRLPMGSILVMQVHYNLLANNGMPDQSSVQLELTDTAPAKELVNMIVLQPNLTIKAGDANAQVTVDTPVSKLAARSGLPAGDITVYGAFPHMHLLGTHIVSSISGGSLIADLPHWDFHWQMNYMFTQPFNLTGTDVLHLECDYDNSAAHQPIINGQQQAPHDVTWGEGTLDEMCVSLFLASTK